MNNATYKIQLCVYDVVLIVFEISFSTPGFLLAISMHSRSETSKSRQVLLGVMTTNAPRQSSAIWSQKSLNWKFHIPALTAQGIGT